MLTILKQFRFQNHLEFLLFLIGQKKRRGKKQTKRVVWSKEVLQHTHHMGCSSSNLHNQE